MMHSFSALVRAYCLTCIFTGVLQEFFSSGSSRKVIQSVTGLYMIATLLHCFSGLSFEPLPSSTVSPQVSQDAANYPYTDTLLLEIQHNLENSCETRLQQANISAQAEIELNVTDQGDITIQKIRLIGESSPQAEEILSDFSANEILWQTGETYG